MPLYLFGTAETNENGKRFKPNLIFAETHEKALEKAFLIFMDENPTATIEDFESPQDKDIIEIPKDFLETVLSKY
jgi:hypothetical protein